MEGNRQFNWYNFWVCFLVSLGQIAFGYPSSVIASTLGLPVFHVYMGLVDPATGTPTHNSENIIGAMNGVFQAGAFFGVMIGSWVMDKYGRKMGMAYCSFFSIFGGALICGSRNAAMFIVARFFAGMGSWGFLAVTPVYTAELAPPSLRGFFVGMNGVNIALGYALASYFGMAFYYADNGTTQWRGPLGMALIWPFMMLVVILVVPESPRYLLMKNEIEKARDIVMKLHSIKGDADQVFARSEFYQMQKQTELDRRMATGWLDMIRRRGARNRTALACGFAFLGQSTAVLVIANYGPVIYSKLGYNTEDQLRFQCGWITVGIIFNFVGAAIMDKLGRRPLMIFGVAGCCVCLILEAAMVAEYADEGTNKAGLAMGVAATYLFLACFSVGVDVAGVVFYGELFPNHQRGKGLSLAVATIALTDLVYLQVTATAFANIGWKFYLVFIIISGVGAIVLYFVLPETKGIPLEEMAKIFGDEDEVVVYAADIHIDHDTHDLVVEDHKTHLTHVATEGGGPHSSGKGDEKVSTTV